MSRRWRPLAPLVPTLAFLTTFALHTYLGSYSRYIADDFCSAAMARRFGVLRAVWYWYLNWTGRYSASTLDAIFGLLGPVVTPFVPFFVIVAWLTVLTWTATLLLGRYTRHSFLFSVPLAAATLFLTLVLSPSVPQALYWGQGMRSIAPPLILMVGFVAILALAEQSRSRKSQRAAWSAGTFLLALVMGGLNETFTALELSLLAGALLVALLLARTRGNPRHIGLLISGLLGATLAFLFVFIAPGNAARQSFYPPPPALMQILKISVNSFGHFLAATVGGPDRLLAACGVLLLSVFVGRQLSLPVHSLWLAGLTLGVGLLFAFVCFLPAAYGLSDAPPDRTLTIPAYLLSIALVFAGVSLGSYLNSTEAGRSFSATLDGALIAVGAVLCVGSVVLVNRQLVTEVPQYASYASHWDIVNAQILSARDEGQSQVVIQAIPNWASLNEPNDNPKFWVNVCYREYYGITVIATGPP